MNTSSKITLAVALFVVAVSMVHGQVPGHKYHYLISFSAHTSDGVDQATMETWTVAPIRNQKDLAEIAKSVRRDRHDFSNIQVEAFSRFGD